MKAMRFDKDAIRVRFAGWIELHLRFHGYGSGEWTDSAGADTSPTPGRSLPRLHLVTRSDSPSATYARE